MDLGDVPYKTMSPSGRLALTDPDPYIYHFPDGNAGVARSLVRTLIPAALPGSTMEDLVTTPVDYAVLDVAGNDVRLRLNASVVRVKHDGDPAQRQSVTLTYVEGGSSRRSRPGRWCWPAGTASSPTSPTNCGEAQVEALNDQIKVPLIYTNVLLRNWQALDKRQDRRLQRPSTASGAAPRSTFRCRWAATNFRHARPIRCILHLSKIPLTGDPAMSARDQATAGRYALTEHHLRGMEREIRDMLQPRARTGGFDAARDIEAITSNRWSHGYALEYMRPWDQYWPDGPLPIETARKPLGPHRHRQFRFRRLCLCPFRHRPGGARRA